MAWNFDGSTGYLTAGQAPVATAPFTMACWFRKTSEASSEKELVGISDPSSNHCFLLGAGDGSSRVVFCAAYTGSSWEAATSSTVFSPNVWNHAAAVFVADNCRHVYLNGGGKGTGSLSAHPLGLNATAIGCVLIATPTEKFAGDIAEVAIWNAALTDDEIAVLAKGASPLCLWHRLPNLVVYQDIIRPLNRLGIGPAMTAVEGTSVVAHPRMIYPACHSPVGLAEVLFAVPYRLAAAAAHAGRVSQGWAALAGAEQGATCPVGEVSS
jgi:hypothetical protein